MKLDKKNVRIMRALQEDARQSFVQLGKRVGLGSLSAERRARQLLQGGAIELLHANVDMARLGFGEYRLYFKFDVMDRGTEEEVLALFKAYPRTGWGVVCEGEYGVLWRIFARNEEEVEAAIFLAMEKFGRRIIEKVVVTTMHETYLPWRPLFGSGQAAPKTWKKAKEGIKQANLDAKDMKILSMLFGNAREKGQTIAKKVGLTPEGVNYRMKRLAREGVLNGYTAWFDARKLGFNYYKMLLWLRGSTREQERKFLAYCLQRDEVVYVNKTMGSWDMEVDIIARSNEEMHGFVREIKTKFGDFIGRHEILLVVAERTLNPLREFG